MLFLLLAAASAQVPLREALRQTTRPTHAEFATVKSQSWAGGYSLTSVDTGLQNLDDDVAGTVYASIQYGKDKRAEINFALTRFTKASKRAYSAVNFQVAEDTKGLVDYLKGWANQVLPALTLPYKGNEQLIQGLNSEGVLKNVQHIFVKFQDGEVPSDEIASSVRDPKFKWLAANAGVAAAVYAKVAPAQVLIEITQLIKGPFSKDVGICQEVYT